MVYGFGQALLQLDSVALYLFLDHSFVVGDLFLDAVFKFVCLQDGLIVLLQVDVQLMFVR